MKKPLLVSNVKVSRVLISITKDRNKYFVETKEQSLEYVNYNLDEIKLYYDNLEQVEEFLNCFLNNDTTYRGPVYNVSIVCNNDIVEICIEYSYKTKEDESDTDSGVIFGYKSDSVLKVISSEIMDKVSSLDNKTYKVIIQGKCTKNGSKIYIFKEGTEKFNLLSDKIASIDVNDIGAIKKEILEILVVTDNLLPKDRSKTVFIPEGNGYDYIEITPNGRGLCYTVDNLDNESKESILEDFMKLF